MLLTFLSAAIFFAWLILYLKDKVHISPALYQARWALLSLGCFQLVVFFQTFALPSSVLSLLSPIVFNQYQLAGFGESEYLSVNVNSSLKSGALGLGLSLSFVLALLLVNSKER